MSVDNTALLIALSFGAICYFMGRIGIKDLRDENSDLRYYLYQKHGYLVGKAERRVKTAENSPDREETSNPKPHLNLKMPTKDGVHQIKAPDFYEAKRLAIHDDTQKVLKGDHPR